jgi:hypothetical protein
MYADVNYSFGESKKKTYHGHGFSGDWRMVEIARQFSKLPELIPIRQPRRYFVHDRRP